MAQLSKVLKVVCWAGSRSRHVNSGATDIVSVTLSSTAVERANAVHKSLGNGEGTPP